MDQFWAAQGYGRAVIGCAVSRLGVAESPIRARVVAHLPDESTSLRIGPASIPTIDSALIGFAEYLATGYDADTINRYPRNVRRCAAFNRWTLVTQFTAQGIGAWLRKHFKGKTYNSRLSGIRCFLEWACDSEGLIPSNPAAKLKLVSAPPGQGMRPFTEDEVERIFAAVQGRRLYAYVVLRFTALRKGNVFRGIRLRHWNRDKAYLDIPAGELKNRKRLVIPLHPVAHAALVVASEGKGRDDYFFPFNGDKETFYADMRAAGVERVNERGEHAFFNSFRHGFGAALAEADVHPKKAQQLMGHSDIRLTMNIYSRVVDPSLRAALEKIPMGLSADSIKTCATNPPPGREKNLTTGPSGVAAPTGIGTIHGLARSESMRREPTTTRSDAARSGGMADLASEVAHGARPPHTVNPMEKAGRLAASGLPLIKRPHGDSNPVGVHDGSENPSPILEHDDGTPAIPTGGRDLRPLHGDVSGSGLRDSEGRGPVLLPLVRGGGVVGQTPVPSPRSDEGRTGPGARAGELARQAGGVETPGSLRGLRADGQAPGRGSQGLLEDSGAGGLRVPQLSHEAASPGRLAHPHNQEPHDETAIGSRFAHARGGPTGHRGDGQCGEGVPAGVRVPATSAPTENAGRSRLEVRPEQAADSAPRTGYGVPGRAAEVEAVDHAPEAELDRHLSPNEAAVGSTPTGGISSNTPAPSSTSPGLAAGYGGGFSQPPGLAGTETKHGTDVRASAPLETPRGASGVAEATGHLQVPGRREVRRIQEGHREWPARDDAARSTPEGAPLVSSPVSASRAAGAGLPGSGASPPAPGASCSDGALHPAPSLCHTLPPAGTPAGGDCPRGHEGSLNAESTNEPDGGRCLSVPRQGAQADGSVSPVSRFDRVMAFLERAQAENARLIDRAMDLLKVILLALAVGTAAAAAPGVERAEVIARP